MLPVTYIILSQNDVKSWEVAYYTFHIINSVFQFTNTLTYKTSRNIYRHLFVVFKSYYFFFVYIENYKYFSINISISLFEGLGALTSIISPFLLNKTNRGIEDILIFCKISSWFDFSNK